MYFGIIILVLRAVSGCRILTFGSCRLHSLLPLERRGWGILTTFLVRILAGWRLSSMMTAMANDGHSSIQTRPSLLNRLKTGDDSSSWQEFYRVYGKLVRDFAIQAGLTDTEADEAVQETAIATARNLPEFRYDPKVCRFKSWLLNQSSWRIKDQFKKRKVGQASCLSGAAGTPVPLSDDTARTATINRVPDPAAVNLDALFEVEWRKNLLATALERLKPKFSLKQIQIFDLHALKEWPAVDVAKSLGVSLANVYVTKHRIATALKKEIVRLEREREELAALKREA
jgi:RNA polymerase sigma factor (sigma-70 family)